MTDKIDIDVSGKDILNRNFSICIVLNDKYKYGYRFEHNTQEVLKFGYKSGKYRLKVVRGSKNLKVRLYSAVVSLLLNELCLRVKVNKNYEIFLCNDLDGYFNAIRQFLRDNTTFKDVIDYIYLTRHPKDSVIQKTVKALSKGIKDDIILPNIKITDIENLISKRKPKK